MRSGCSVGGAAIDAVASRRHPKDPMTDAPSIVVDQAAVDQAAAVAGGPLRFAVFAALSSVALGAFGVQVCPYLHSLGAGSVVVVFGVVFGVLALLRSSLEGRFVTGASALDQPGRQLVLDLGLFIVAGLIVTVVDLVIFGFPVGSGMRLVMGCLTLGLFAALDGALRRERIVVESRRRATDNPVPSGRFFSLSSKFAIVALALFLLVTVDLLMMGARDLVTAFEDTPQVTAAVTLRAQRELVIEGAVTLLVLLPLLANLVLSFAGNLRLFLTMQREALDAVATGRFDVSVPVASHDEFAVIADRTNQMIDGLRDRRRIQQLVGKLASPAVAQRLLSSAGGLQLQGSRRRVVVLFSDVRNFTTRTETSSPEAIVADLNRYFTEMVAVVHAHGGLVDKFIGDGLMAIFGFDDEKDAATAAVLAARDMHSAVLQLNQSLVEPIAIGVGIHVGEAIAGTIGSPDRMEFTFIGDVVNTAARIEGMTRALGASPLISADVLAALSPAAQGLGWVDVGTQGLKGKHEMVQLFGLHLGDPAAATSLPT